jgi:RNA polymerase sigma factor (TIGR02999 family)
MADVTVMLQAVEAGEPGAADRLWRTVYEELKRMAREKMAGESREITLQATALVHEAWLRLAGSDGPSPHWDGRAHFFAAAGEAMRRILVDQARRRLAAKRGGGQGLLPLEEALDIAADEDTKVLEVHEALECLGLDDPHQASIIKLIFFVGLSQKEVAALLGVSEKTIQRQWLLARTSLYQRIKSRESGPPAPPGNHRPP